MSSVLVETRMACMHFKTGTGSGIRALQDVSLSIEPGDFVLLSGPSGSGKTTVLALLGALARPTSGQVIFDGVDLGHCSDTKLTRIRRRIGFVFQQFSLIAGLPVWENITYPLIPLGVSRTERRGRAAELVAELGLKDKSHARPEELSGGEQQRVAIARALVNRPQLLLADEPTSNLDQAAGQSLLSKFKDIHQRGTCVVVSSHDPRMIPLATREFVMEAGRLKGAS